MSMKNSYLGLASMILFDGGMGGIYPQERNSKNKITAEDIIKKKEALKAKEIERMKSRGMKEFSYFKPNKSGTMVEIKIYARNKKNADRKARNKGVKI